jgi:hypothetical protein
MTTETTMTTDAATTNESTVASAPATETATAADVGGQQQTLVTQTDADKGTDQAAGDKQQVAGAPESYNFVAPEGDKFSDEVLSVYSDVAKDLNLTQEAAQSMLDRLAPAVKASQEKQMEVARTEWADQALADKEFGGEKAQENLAVAKKALDAFGSDGLRELLDATGLGNHPEIIRAFYRAGKAISEDGFVAGRGGDTQNGDARKLYSASNMNP